MKLIKIVDFFSTNSFHEIFNTSLLGICAQFSDKIIYRLPRNYSNTIKEVLTNFDNSITSKITLQKIRTYEEKSKKGAFLRHVIGFWTCIYEFFILRKNELLIFNYTNYFSLPLILIINRLLRKKVIFTMHGELELIDEKPKWYKVSYIFKKIIDLSLKHLFRKSNSYILILGDSIRDNLDNAYPGIADSIISICHPRIHNSYLHEENSNEGSNNSKKLIIGTIGVMNNYKGLNNLLFLADTLKEQIKMNLIEIRSIGMVKDINTKDYPLITWIGADKPLPRKEYMKNVRNLDYILYLYSNQYKYCASGAILDALESKKPIISLTNNYFNYILNGINIGYLLPDMNSIIELIKDILLSNKRFESHYDFDIFAKRTSIYSIGYNMKIQLEEKSLI